MVTGKWRSKQVTVDNCLDKQNSVVRTQTLRGIRTGVS